MPYEGLVRIKTDIEPVKTKYACKKTLKEEAEADVLCRQLGYTRADPPVNKPVPPDTEVAIFTGEIDCDGRENRLSDCSITAPYGTCSNLPYIKCEFLKW